MASGGFNSKSIGLKIQKKVLSKFSNKTVAKTLIDDEFGSLLDTIHGILGAELGQTKADKAIKNLIKITVKLGILFKNNQFNSEEIGIGMELRKKLRNAALTVISFHEVDFSYDKLYLIKLVTDIGDLLHKLVERHLTQKSHQRINMVIETISNGDLLDKVFLADGTHHSKLPQISQAFDKVVDTEW